MAIREGLLAKQRELSYEHTRLEGFLERAEKEKLEAQQEATASTNRAKLSMVVHFFCSPYIKNHWLKGCYLSK
jgi:hypothetical protein